MNYTLEDVNKFEKSAYENDSHENWQKAVEIIEELYNENKHDVNIVVKRFFLYWYLALESQCVGYEISTEKRKWFYKSYVDTYRETEKLFKENAYYLWIVGYIMHLMPSLFLNEGQKLEEANFYENKSLEYIKKAMRVEPKNPLIPINTLKKREEIFNKYSKEEINFYYEKYLKNNGIIGIYFETVYHLYEILDI